MSRHPAVVFGKSLYGRKHAAVIVVGADKGDVISLLRYACGLYARGRKMVHPCHMRKLLPHILCIGLILGQDIHVTDLLFKLLCSIYRMVKKEVALFCLKEVSKEHPLTDFLCKKQ